MIDLHLSKRLFVPKFFPYLTDYSHRWEMYMGSAGSAKSYFITQKIILRCLNETCRCAICRRFQVTLRNSCFALAKDILKKWRIERYCKINESEKRITFPNGSEIIFLGLDEETKLLSLATMAIIFVEEAYEVPKDIVEQINLRLRGDTQQQIILAWNPISINSYLHDYWEQPPKNALCVHSTYKDNPFLDEAYIEQLEELRVRNPAKAKIFCDGEWGNDPSGLVFQNNWRIEPIDEYTLAKECEHRAGADFGFIDPSTIIDSLFDKKRTIYVFNEFYKTGCQLDEIAKAANEMGLKHTSLYMDAAEPRSIDYMKKQGFNAKPCIKGANSVQARIAFLQNMEIVVDPRCKNLITELSNFSYKKDKQTGKYIDDEYTHEWSHAIDGLGYAYSDIYTKSRLRTLDKSILGL